MTIAGRRQTPLFVRSSGAAGGLGRPLGPRRPSPGCRADTMNNATNVTAPGRTPGRERAAQPAPVTGRVSSDSSGGGGGRGRLSAARRPRVEEAAASGRRTPGALLFGRTARVATINMGDRAARRRYICMGGARVVARVAPGGEGGAGTRNATDSGGRPHKDAISRPSLLPGEQCLS